MIDPERVDRGGPSAGEIDQLLTDIMPALAAAATEAESQYNLPHGLPAERRVPPPELSARAWSCQQLSSLVREVLWREGIANAEVVKKELGAIDERFLAHVVTRCVIDGEEWYIDPTYSQIFKHFGLGFHQLRPGYSPYPEELHIMYRTEDVPVLAEWAAAVMRQYWQLHGYDLPFQQAYGYTVSEDGWNPQKPNLIRPVSTEDMEVVFAQIWDPTDYEPYEGIRSSDLEGLSRLYSAAMRHKLVA